MSKQKFNILINGNPINKDNFIEFKYAGLIIPKNNINLFNKNKLCYPLNSSIPGPYLQSYITSRNYMY